MNKPLNNKEMIHPIYNKKFENGGGKCS